MYDWNKLLQESIAEFQRQQIEKPKTVTIPIRQPKQPNPYDIQARVMFGLAIEFGLGFGYLLSNSGYWIAALIAWVIGYPLFLIWKKGGRR